MNSKDIRIVFMGTPEFAATSLNALVSKGYNVVGVVTVPDRKAGRGRKLIESDVKKAAVNHNIPVLQPEKLRNEEFLSVLKGWNPQLMIVVAFRMLPEVVWSMPEFGTFNLHGSLLPQYRGAAPINHAIINGEVETGVTTFLIDKEIDTGNVLLQDKLPVLPEDNAGTVHDKMMVFGAELVCKTVDGLADNSLKAKHQDEFVELGTPLNAAPKIFKEDCKLDWTLSGTEIVNKVRGLSPYPAAWTELERDGSKTSAKIYSLTFASETHNLAIGTLVKKDKKTLLVAVKDGFCSIHELHLAGKKRLEISAFLLGFNDVELYKLV